MLCAWWWIYTDPHSVFPVITKVNSLHGRMRAKASPFPVRKPPVSIIFKGTAWECEGLYALFCEG